MVRFTSKDEALYGEFAVQPEQAWLVWGKAFHGKVNGFFAPSVGHFQGAPWAGPYLSLSAPIARVGGQDLSVGTFHWPAFFPMYEPAKWRNDGKKNPERVKVGYLANVNISWGPVTLNQSLLNFLDDPWNSLPGIALDLPLTGMVRGNFGYTRNVNARKDMWVMGVTLDLNGKK